MRNHVKSVLCGLCALLLLSCAAFAGPIKLNEVSGDAVWAAHFDMERFMSTRLAELLLGQLEDEGELKKINAFGTMFEFNPLEDLYSVTAYGTSFVKEEAVAVIKGRFQTEKVLALMQMEGTHTQISHGDDTLHKWADSNECFYICFIGSGQIVFSNSLDLAKGALDVLRGSKESLAAGGKLDDLRSLPDGTFFTAAINGFGEIAKIDAEAAILQKAEKAVVAIGEVEGTDFVDISLTAADAQTASQIHAIAQGILALGSMVGDQEPELAKLVQAARLTLDGRTITLRETQPADELMKFLIGKMDD